ncbi:leptin receptor isoform 1-T2 [Syngnathus typhle]
MQHPTLSSNNFHAFNEDFKVEVISTRPRRVNDRLLLEIKGRQSHVHAVNARMGQSAMLSVLIHVLLILTGTVCAKPEEEAGVSSGVLDLPWQDQACYDSPPAQEEEAGDTHPHCYLGSIATGLSLKKDSGGTCLNMLCRIDEKWESLTCDLGLPSAKRLLHSAPVAVRLQRFKPLKNDTSSLNSTNVESYQPVVCETKDSVLCSISIGSASFVALVTARIYGCELGPVLLNVPARPVKPRTPLNLSHFQTIKPELILQWDEPKEHGSAPLRYEVRYSNATHPSWQVNPLQRLWNRNATTCRKVVSAGLERRLLLDLEPEVNYTLEVRCSDLHEPPLWSDWSEAHHIYLGMVSYIPEKVLAHPGENVSVYCVFNDPGINANSAVWMLNFEQTLSSSQYHSVNQRVSHVTIQPSDSGMYELLQCRATKEWTIPYSIIYLEGASIDIKCETSGDIDAMDCSWKNTSWIKPKFQYIWSDLPCDAMEETERKGENVGEMGPDCLPIRSKQQACTVQDVRRNCYKLWLEMLSHQGPIRSKPVYVSPLEYVKPNKPSDVKAVNLKKGVLRITWRPPSLPVQGVQCQLRFHSPSTTRAQPDWKFSNAARVSSAEIPIPDMCQVHAVQVKCMPANGTGYWSDWSDLVYSLPQNSRAPEHGPDFWRLLQDDQLTNSTNVTLLITHLPTASRSYCIDGYIVQHRSSGGIVKREKIELMSSYSFEWNREFQSVTVEAYNSLGSSTKNMNMTLERRPKRRSVHSFHALLINNTCASLHWSLVDNSSAPLFMVVQWAPQRPPDGMDSGRTWLRLPFTERSVHLTGDFYASEEYAFYLYPVFSEGEGQPAFTIATRRDPAAYTTFLVIALLSVVLFVTLVLSQNQMKRLVWKDVPNPKKCSWAKGLNFKKADTFHELFQASDVLPAWPLLLPSENISKVVIMEKANMSVLGTALVRSPLASPTPDAASFPSFLEGNQNASVGGEARLGLGLPLSLLDLDILSSPSPQLEELQLMEPSPSITENSAQSSVTYATVLLIKPKQEKESARLSDRDGSSSSDEGNFSANNSDISGSFPGGLWELESCHGGELDDGHRRSCSYNSAEELSESSDQEDAAEAKDLYYLGGDYQAEAEEAGGEAEEKEELLKSCPAAESHLPPPEPVCDLSPPLYMPQFRTAPYTRQLPD